LIVGVMVQALVVVVMVYALKIDVRVTEDVHKIQMNCIKLYLLYLKRSKLISVKIPTMCRSQNKTAEVKEKSQELEHEINLWKV
ncbi:hypothetical protein ISN45_Aa05g005030, partial [Arabidopsis thaliana x Arabidopsis arenosa]